MMRLVGSLVTLAVVVPSIVGSGGPAASSEAAPPPSAAPPVAPSASPIPWAGPRWTSAGDGRVGSSGVLRHAVTLGDEVIALAKGHEAGRSGAVHVLATGDGSRWTQRGGIWADSVDGLLADGTVLYAVGADDGALIWRSTDAGRSWQRLADATPFSGAGEGLPGSPRGATVEAIARGPAGLVAVGAAVAPDTGARHGAAWRSADGLTWERLAGVGDLAPFHALAADASVYVSVGSSITAPTFPFGADPHVLRWSTDGETWTDAVADLAPMESVDGVTLIEGEGFLAWGSTLDDATDPAIIWRSADGRTWEPDDPDPALAGATIASIRSLESGALTMAVGGAPSGAWAFPSLGVAWRRDVIRRDDRYCVEDVASVRAILVAVGGSCRLSHQHGRAWTSPLEP